ncbi:MAG: hypothetical protein O6943_09560 [Bacteroidetes bacterium]|nr:hypothetical protein [Bacteroidota bacterium]
MIFVKIFSFAILFLSTTISAQDRVTAIFGKPNPQELKMTSYKYAPNFSAVVLFEKEKDYFKVVDNRIKIVKEIHRKIKVFDAKKFTGSTVEIPYRNSKNQKDKIIKLKAITHNGQLQNYIQDDKIYTQQVSAYYAIKSFTFGNVKNGSILEYTYTLLTDNLFAIDGWQFQGSIPKIYSEFETEIPGNYVYNKVLIGNEKLDINRVRLVRDCFSLPGYVKNADCEAGIYAMHNVPPFISEEYMLSPKNYLAKINFELKEQYDHKGYKTELTKEWKDIDKEFRTDKNVGRQLNNASFYRSKVPDTIVKILNSLERAKAVYSWIQKYYTWNEKYNLYTGVNVKDAYQRQTGNISEINLSLINALNAVDLEAKIMLLSTRENGLPTQSYPVLTEFNYLICFLTIDNMDYVLDASDKFVPFDRLPFRALNLTGRVMDFKKGSFWYDIKPKKANIYFVKSKLKMNPDGILQGDVVETWLGYLGINRRRALSQIDSKEYAQHKENNRIGVEVSNYSIENDEDIDTPLKESYTLKLELEEIDNTLYLYPFSYHRYFSKNPFQLERRNYPVEFGYPLNITYLLSLDTGGNFEIENLPENIFVALPDNGGNLNVVYSETNGVINIRFSLKILKERFSPDYYVSLKDLFNKIMTVQANDVIPLKKL